MWNKLDFLKMLMYLGWLISKMMGDAKKYHLLARGYVHVVCFFVCFRGRTLNRLRIYYIFSY
jgi:hypothetical protein